MFTILITEYLFKSISESKRKKINSLKALVYSHDFLDGNVLTKGLLVSGFQLLEQSHNTGVALGQCLLTSDCICAFTECWK